MADKGETVLEQGAEARIDRALQLAHEAGAYWQTALRGLFALPNATALSLSSAVLYVTGIAEQSYQRIEALTERIGGEITREVGEATRAATLRKEERARAPQA
jgi:hypothetical protein